MTCSRRALRLVSSATLISLVTLTLCATSASAAATRTWVSGVGDDANPCSRTAPCKTFAGAISKTADGGEIDALDPGGFGAVTITKPITIVGTGTLGSILNSGTTGIIINITGPYARPDVTIRDVSIMGGGELMTACPWSGISGIRVMSAGHVQLENVTIGEQNQNGVLINPTLLNPHVVMDGVNINHACGSAVNVAPAAGRTAAVSIDNSTISVSGTGITAGAGANVRVARSSLVNNTTALNPTDGGTIEVSRETSLFDNGTDGTPTRIWDAIAVGPAGPAGVPGPSGPSGANSATVTKLVAVFGAARSTGAKGKKVVLPYAATAAGDATLTVAKGSTTLAIVTSKAKAGKNTISWNGKIAGKAAKAGTYKLKLTVVGSGQSTTDTATVTLR